MARSREDRAGGRYGSKDTKKPTQEENHPAEPEAQEAGTDGGSGATTPDSAPLRADAYKRMEKERRDLHGSHREQIRQMQARHEAEMAKMAPSAEPAAAAAEK